MAKRGQSLYDWCQENGEWGQQLLFEFGDGNGSETFFDEETGMLKGPMDFSRGTNKKIPWTCKDGHRWKAAITNRTNGKVKCPYCTGKKVSDKNGLKNWCQINKEQGQKILQEWTGLDEYGNVIDINEVSYGSHKKVQWKCNRGHKWVAQIKDRTSRGCPYCFSKNIVREDNRFDEWCRVNGEYGQQLLKEWTGVDENNNPIQIHEISYGSTKKVWWKCKKGHQWISNMMHRTAKGFERGCPYCNPKSTSFPEQFIYHSLLQLFPNTISREKYQGYEYDITVPELNLRIEYSGINWHADKLGRDEEKRHLCKNHGINFLQIYTHRGQIVNEAGNETDDRYDKEQIIYRVNSKKDYHIEQLKNIVSFILEQYSPEHTIEEIDFDKAERDANSIMYGSSEDYE